MGFHGPQQTVYRWECVRLGRSSEAGNGKNRKAGPSRLRLAFRQDPRPAFDPRHGVRNTVGPRRHLDGSTQRGRNEEKVMRARFAGRRTQSRSPSSLEDRVWKPAPLLTPRGVLYGRFRTLRSSAGQVPLRDASRSSPFPTEPREKRVAPSGLTRRAFARTRRAPTSGRSLTSIPGDIRLLSASGPQVCREAERPGHQPSLEAWVWRPAPLLTPVTHPSRDFRDRSRLNGARSLREDHLLRRIRGKNRMHRINPMAHAPAHPRTRGPRTYGRSSPIPGPPEGPGTVFP